MRSRRRGKGRAPKSRSTKRKRPPQPAQNKEVVLRSPNSPPVSVLRSNPFYPPIRNAEKEKFLLEKKGLFGWKRWLLGKSAPPVITLSRNEVMVRIADVYRLCFERSGQQDLSILSDLVAHYPDAVFVAPWIKKLVGSIAFSRFHSLQARRILHALVYRYINK